MSITIDNIVTSGSLGQKIKLEDLNTMPNFSYDPELYHGGYLKLSKYTSTIYSSGKYIIPGIQSIDDIELNHNELIDSLREFIDINLIEKAVIKNIVAHSTLDHPINLAKKFTELSTNINCNVTYEPEVFPGLCIKMDIGSSNVFSSGKYLLLGTKTFEQLDELNNKVRQLIDQ